MHSSREFTALAQGQIQVFARVWLFMRTTCWLERHACRAGVQVKIMRPHDAEGKQGPKTPLPDVVTIHEPKEDTPIPEGKGYEKEEQY